METKQLNNTLNNLIGHLTLDTPEEQKKFDRLTKSLSQSSLEEELQAPVKTSFKFEKSDIFFKDNIRGTQKKAILNITKNREKKKSKTQYKVFRREAPIREHLLYNSIADWAIGARVDHSLGPFKNKDGRQFWYDFFPIEKKIALYIQGEAHPVLLFSIKQGRTLTPNLNVPIRVNPSKTYTLNKGSIWILSKFLAPNAPTGKYTGLTINSGKITLNSAPQLVNEKLTASANTMIKVQLQLDQPEVEDADKNSPYGADARKMQLELPKKLAFHFSGNGRKIDAVSNANWGLYGQKMAFDWQEDKQATYDAIIQRIYFSFKASEQKMSILEHGSPFNSLKNEANLQKSGWVLPVADIDITQPLAAEGIGGIFAQTQKGISTTWQGMEGGGLLLGAPAFLISPGQIFLLDLLAGNPHAQHSLDLWKDELNPFGTTLTLGFTDKTSFYYASNANGNELLMTFTNAKLNIDRPVRVNGTPPTVRSMNSLLLIAVSKANKLIYLLDDNLILDDAEITNEDPFIPERMAFAIKNALFKVTQPNGCLLFGTLSDTYTKVEQGFLFLTFGLFAYIPTLPDPYAANLGILRRQIRGREGNPTTGAVANPQQFTAWLVCRVAWDVPLTAEENDRVEVSFHFAPLNNPFASISLESPEEDAQNTTAIGTGIHTDSGVHSVSRSSTPVPSLETTSRTDAFRGTLTNTDFSNETGRDVHTASAAASSDLPRLPDYESQWDKETSRYRRDLFALLDVSTNADLFGISFDLLTRRDFRVTTGVNANGENTSSFFPVQVVGMEVVSAGANVKAFTVPQISWEPVFNLTPQVPPPTGPIPGDPDFGFNYYPNDGGPSHILNNSMEQVALAPLPITEFLVKKRAEDDDFQALSFFTLPFGLKAVASLEQQYGTGNETRDGGDINQEDIQFENEVKNGLQLRLDAGMPLREGDSKMFMGTTVQLNNILNLFGGTTGNSTLGGSVTEIFNGEFFNPQPGPFNLLKNRGVPMTRMDMSGYGANMFSNWLNTKAALAETSQAKFDIFMGRCAHEVIQVKSIVYPWAIKVVRTITLFRVASGYTYRFDSGWRAESDGKFDFRYFVFVPNPANPPVPPLIADERSTDYEIHPGLVKGLYNISNITETSEIEPFIDQLVIANGELYVDEDGREVTNTTGGNLSFEVKLQPLYFDADVEIEHTTTGFVSKKTADGEKDVVPSKRIVGFVQLAPKGIPLNNEALKRLITRQGTIGGPLDCEVDLAESTQKMRLSRFDFSNSFGNNGVDPTFAIAGRGNVLLPKDGSWSMVKHERSTGDVSPVPTNLSIPVIREGKIVKDVANDSVKVESPPGGALTRIAEPTELLRNPVDTTLNYGFLQSTDTQKALFLTPSFKQGDKKLLSKTPPLFVDAFRIVNSKGIFPNIGDATNFIGDTIGEAVLMKKNGGFPFDTSSLQDLGQDVFELMDIQDTIDGVKQQGLQLLHNPEEVFDLPTEFELIDVGDGNFRIYIEYAKTDNNGGVEEAGSLEFDINSVAKSWKSKMNNIGLVIDLAGIKRLMTIRGNWDSKNGEEASYPQPELKFSPELQPLVDLLEILQSLQSGDYGAAIGKGLKLAMSNKAGSWEYKFEASKEIPVLRFPVPDAVYNDPNTPFKLECGLTIGAYFNAALKVTTDANELLPSAGGSLGFYARLSVMCVSISAATIYAIGQANVAIAADTKIGPSLRMKFGFGAQIVIGLPVAGNVSVLFVVGAEIFIASGIVEVSAFLLFEGHAEILGGIVAITIRIEAKGTYTKKAIGTGSRTDLECQVTFGLDISIAFIINISFSESWSEQRQIA
ncbi:hypothetical protein [Spongiimicrobium salis]|uniref:hypothetical protein n=1 Tax=Spongiimicrobium salis TaxID=1667022 RepID=UPI00374D7793